MIARFAITADALRPQAGSTSRQIRAIHERLTRALAAHGILVLGDAPAKREFQAALEELERQSPDAFKAWDILIASWTGNRRIIGAKPEPTRTLDSVDCIEDLATEWRGKAQLAVLSNGQADRLGVPPDDLSYRDDASGLELVRVEDADQAQLLGKMRDRADRHIVLRDTRREEIWREFMQPLAREAKEITIRDHYLGKAAFLGTEPQPNELEWLLERIDRDARKGVSVRLLIGTAPVGNDDRLPPDAAEVAAALRRGWLARRTGGAIGQIEIIGATAPKYQERDARRAPVPHDRWILFDTDRAIELPAGFDRLRRFKTSEPITVTYHWRQTDLTKYASETEQILRHPTRSQGVLGGL